LNRSRQETLLLIANCLLIVAVLVPSWQRIDVQTLLEPTGLLLALFLIASVVLAGLFPIHLRAHTKISVTSVPTYLMAVLSPPLITAFGVGAAWLLVELWLRSKHKTSPREIALTGTRWALVAYLGAVVAHWPSSNSLAQGLVLFAAAAVLFLGDVISVSLQIAPLNGEPPWRILRACLKAGGVAEAIQYGVGILGALAALQSVWMLGLIAIPTGLTYFFFKNLLEMRGATRQMLERMADAVDLRDPYTGGHSRRVAAKCEEILSQLGISGPELDLIVSAARVHDIGKIGIPDKILQKPGRLTPQEKAIMDSHAEQGAELLACFPDLARGAEIVRHHHERWDGAGYPSRIGSFDIPLGARVVAVADSFDAMTTDRPYRPALSVQQAAAILRQERGRQWDPEIVDAFLHTLADRLEERTPAPAKTLGSAHGAVSPGVTV
jgi:HD-GYP domain-containing protein (c-di-GMP phosphodiesterase class II)